MVATLMPRAQARASGATPLLAFVAGEFATAIAAIWRAPHADFFALPAARRHAAAIALGGLSSRFRTDAEIRRFVAFARDAELARMLVGDQAPGFMRMLARAGEVLWTRRQYRDLLELHAERAANALLRHMDEVRPDAFAPIVELPAALRTVSILRVANTVHAARALAQALDLAVRMRGPQAAPRLAARWTAGGEAHAVFERVREDLTPDEFGAPTAPPRLPGQFVRITRRAELERVAREFRNCLADHAGRVAEGRMAVYVWRAQPKVAIALNWDVAGWRLAEAKLVDNNDVDEAQLHELVAMLARRDVRTGPSVDTLIRRVSDHVYGETHLQRPGADFMSALELGDLWS